MKAVTVTHIAAKDLVAAVQLEKDAGKRVLALSPSQFQTLKTGMKVTKYVLVTQ